MDLEVRHLKLLQAVAAHGSLTRAGGGHNRVVDEERNSLLMYLREFANADGALPVDFDGLVRDSFGDLIGVG